MEVDGRITATDEDAGPLRSYDIVDTAPEDAFDDIVRLTVFTLVQLSTVVARWRVRK